MDLISNEVFIFSHVSTPYEVSLAYETRNRSIIPRLVVTPSGDVQQLIWDDQQATWQEREDACDVISCGPNSVCNPHSFPACSCLMGTEPRSVLNWSRGDSSSGCRRISRIECGTGDGFVLVRGTKLPETSNSVEHEGLSQNECEDLCFFNCTCTAYASSEEGIGCIMWTGDLIGLRRYANGGNSIYIRLSSSPLGMFIDSKHTPLSI